MVPRNGDAIAPLTPLPEATPIGVREAFRAWREAGEPEKEFVRDLEEVSRADRVASPAEPTSDLPRRQAVPAPPIPPDRPPSCAP